MKMLFSSACRSLYDSLKELEAGNCSIILLIEEILTIAALDTHALIVSLCENCSRYLLCLLA